MPPCPGLGALLVRDPRQAEDPRDYAAGRGLAAAVGEGLRRRGVVAVCSGLLVLRPVHAAPAKPKAARRRRRRGGVGCARAGVVPRAALGHDARHAGGDALRLARPRRRRGAAAALIGPFS